MSDTPIADHALLSDCHSAALVTRSGSVDWLCFPRFDAPSVFARILDEEAGHWRVAPAGEFESERRYVERSMVLETTFRTGDGEVVLTDAMALGPNREGHELGAGAPHVLLRTVRGIRGAVEMESEFAPRPEYGLIHPMLIPSDGGLRARAGADVLALSQPPGRTMVSDDATATIRFTVAEGETVGLAMHRHASWEDAPRIWSQEEIAEALERTIDAWRKWSAAHQNYEGPWSDLVYHSGAVLQALTYQPTGAIVAAPTTSLPEEVGGVRNWDYRYAWVRDASFTLNALWVAACPDEAHEFFGWLAAAVASQLQRGKDLQIMFGIGGERDLTERDLPHLGGWRGSAPVRIGNGAWSQRQLDVYGELLDAAHRLVDRLEGIDEMTAGFLADAADTAAARWKEKDQGIWEIRGEPRDFLYSKLMCWVALDRALDMQNVLPAGDRVVKWEAAREEIREAILEKGWSEEAGAFTQSFGAGALDASSLVMPLVGFLPADDPRILSTIDAIEERLTDDRGLVFRYLAEDGLPGGEGTFLLCTFWLAEARARAGQVDRAREVFERAARYANDVGLLAEEVDPATGEHLGNFPQAFSHIGLINAAWAIAQADEPGHQPREQVRE